MSAAQVRGTCTTSTNGSTMRGALTCADELTTDLGTGWPPILEFAASVRGAHFSQTPTPNP
jgi:hypothetical protein